MSDGDWNEKQTRKEFIDKLLTVSGWGPIVPFAQGKQYAQGSVEEYETETGPADYVLFHNEQPIAIVEGKKVAVAPQNVLTQAERYARGITTAPWRFGGEYRIPFIYSTNGKIVWFRDLRHPLNLSREVAKFHTPAALEEMIANNERYTRQVLVRNTNYHEKLRPYQVEAIQSIEKKLLEGRRNMLVAMATGTGKTFMIINLIYRLMKSGVGRKILFLVDRRALAAQAVTALASFEAEPGLKFDKIYEVYSQRFRREDLEEGETYDPKVLPKEYLTDPKNSQAFVYVSTIQRMRINLFGREGMLGSEIEEDDESEKVDIPIHAFDLIIADECHRGYTSQEESKWREVLNHFDCVKIGLTATPAAHTVSYFKEVVYRYEYERAVKENYLVDYDGVAINSNITVNGVFLKEGEEIGLKNTQTGQMFFDILEDERDLPPTTNEREWSAPHRNQSIVKELKKYFDEQEKEFGHFPKTLIFADNDIAHTSHSDELVRLLREEYNRGEGFVQKITGSKSVDRPLQRIREFRNRPNPGIVVTVDMLSTGVDVPKIENIVFLRNVKSRILFEQMLGRGTRLCPDINKTHFTVFDCFNGTLLEYFKNTTAITAEAPDKPNRSIKEVVEDIANNKDCTYNIRILSKRLLRISKNITEQSRREFNAYLKTDIVEFAAKLEDRLTRDWLGTIAIIKSDSFYDLCNNYERPAPTFTVVPGALDTVETHNLFRRRDGSPLKPADYIKEFEEFVRKNPEHIEAIEILLSRPADFHTDELKALRDELSIQPYDLRDKFSEHNLKRAYENNLADIISIIRHAAKGEPLTTVDTRIKQAMEKVRKDREFTSEQEKWLGLIEKHLWDNLLVEQDDFDYLPLFTREGMSFDRLNKIFEGQLNELLKEINKAVLT